MAKPDIADYFIPSYVRFFISDWSSLQSFIKAHGAPMKNKVAAEAQENKNLCTDLEVNNAINGPYQIFVKMCFNHYAKMIRVRMELNMVNSDFFKRDPQHTNPDNLPENLLKKMSLAECDNLISQMNDWVSTFVVQWRDAAMDWCNRIMSELQMQTGLPFSEIEEKEFMDDEPMSDILDRHTELKIDLPKLKKGEVNFAKYFTLKSTIALHSILNRQHQPHAAADIKKLLKPLKDSLASITREEEQLITAQRAEIQNLVQPFEYKKDAAPA
jgi:hypothetical protein